MSNLDEALARLNGPTTHQSDVDIVTGEALALREALRALLNEYQYCKYCGLRRPFHQKSCPIAAARALLARLEGGAA